MAGRSKIHPQDRKAPKRVFKLNRKREWVSATAPIHYDKPNINGVGPGRSFGIALAQYDTTIKIGLVPCAVGGTFITDWKPGGSDTDIRTHPYDDCLNGARRARKDGILKAILWHQGEQDSNQKMAPEYKSRLYQVVSRFRYDLGIPDLPFIAGQMGRFKGRPWNKWKKMVNQAYKSLVDNISNTAFVSSKGLTDKGDLIHFDSPSARKLGRRYAKAYIQFKTK